MSATRHTQMSHMAPIDRGLQSFRSHISAIFIFLNRNVRMSSISDSSPLSVCTSYPPFPPPPLQISCVKPNPKCPVCSKARLFLEINVKETTFGDLINKVGCSRFSSANRRDGPTHNCARAVNVYVAPCLSNWDQILGLQPPVGPEKTAEYDCAVGEH